MDLPTIIKDCKMSLIELKDICFSYEGETDSVFKDFSMRVEAGECVIVSGENGAGKTTLFRIINGLSFPEAGEYLFDGMRIDASFLKNNANAKLFHKRIGFLFQNPDVMLFNARVYDEIAFGPRQLGLRDEEISARTADCMKLLDIERLKDKAPYHLSFGQKKKVALAAIIALNPEVFVLDEPFAGLDGANQEQLFNLLLSLKKAGKTIIMATHEFSRLEDIKDRTVDILQR